MDNISKKSGRITYGQLDKTLSALGFVRKQTSDFTAYREEEHGALIVLPNRNADSDVGEPHLVTVRNTVTGKGIASLDKFQTLLVGLHVKPTASKLRSPVSRHHDVYVTLRQPSLKAHSHHPSQVKKISRKSDIKNHSLPATGG